ncbi:cation transporter [Thermospira aquatica]|uniref:Cation transporter n=1 Tax=Thermospira aquatica TaxID=2828656 RepID=A0AAX3BAE9_9SPIR|nr:cation transporter [Thermospira aquatica]
MSILFGNIAKSVALVSFGLDSFAESLSGFVILWRFYGSHNMSAEENEKKEKQAITLVGWTFFIFGAYVLVDVIKKLVFKEIPQPTAGGLTILILSLLIMPILYYQKYKTGKLLQSKSLIGDSKETLACIFLSAIILIGLGTNYLWGIWQLDPFLALLVSLFLFREGYHIVREKDACSC